MLHFGSQDTHIPAADVEKVHSAHPEVEIFWYDAGHAFNCDPRPSYNAAAAKEARQRSLDFLEEAPGLSVCVSRTHSHAPVLYWLLATPYWLSFHRPTCTATPPIIVRGGMFTPVISW